MKPDNNTTGVDSDIAATGTDNNTGVDSVITSTRTNTSRLMRAVPVCSAPAAGSCCPACASGADAAAEPPSRPISTLSPPTFLQSRQLDGNEQQMSAP